MKTAYPVTFSVDFHDRHRDRLLTAFRIIVAIPIVLVLSLLTGQSLPYATGANGSNETIALATGGGLLFLPIVLMIVFRQKYPRWWFDWSLQLLRFSNRVSAYPALLDDRYPSTDEEQAVHVDAAGRQRLQALADHRRLQPTCRSGQPSAGRCRGCQVKASASPTTTWSPALAGLLMK